MNKVILDLCGGTGSWSEPYRRAGYNVLVVTLPDIDVRKFARIYTGGAYGILAAPPCTEFAVSGARWWRDKPPELLSEALEVFDACLGLIQRLNPTFWALENPVGRLKRLRFEQLGEPQLTFHPCDYGDPWTKKTLLWGDFAPPRLTRVPPARLEGKGFRSRGGAYQKRPTG